MKRTTILVLAITVCLSVSLPILAIADTDVQIGSNAIIKGNVDIPVIETTEFYSYRVKMKVWDPEFIDPTEYGINTEMSERTDSYGGNSYIWEENGRILYVSDQGYCGYSTQDIAAVSDILMWYGGLSMLDIGVDVFDWSSPDEAERLADAFIKSFGIANAQCINAVSLSKENIECLITEMSSEGYEETEILDNYNDTYILTYVIRLDSIYCDTEWFTMANQRDIEGISLMVMVTRNGVQYLGCSAAIYETYEIYANAGSSILLYDDMLKLLARKFDNLILSDPVEIYAVRLQYVLLPISDNESIYTPCWCFAVPRGSSGRYVWYRFNAYTGKEII